MIKDQATEMVIPGSLNLFEKPIVQKAVVAGFDTEVLPVNYQNMNDEIEFVFGPSENYIDPSEIYLNLKVAIENTKPVVVPDDEKDRTDAGPVNGLFYAMFDRVELQLNDTPLIFSYRDYGYKGWFHTELNYSKFAKESFLRSVLWERDLAKAIDDTGLTAVTGKNSGLVARYQVTEGGKIFELSGRILHELFFLDQYVLPKIQFKIKLVKKNASFCLMSGNTDANFKVTIKEAKLTVRNVKVNEEVSTQIERRLATTPAVYTMYNCTQITSRSILPGAKSYTFDNFFMNDTTPSRMVLALVQHDSYIGSYQKNPFSFVNAGLVEASVVMDQQAQTYRIDGDSKNYLQVYTALSTQLGNKDFCTDLSIKYNDFLNGFFLLAWDLTPTKSTTELQTIASKNVRVELRFKDAVTSPLELIVMSEFPKIFQIDRERKVRVIL